MFHFFFFPIYNHPTQSNTFRHPNISHIQIKNPNFKHSNPEKMSSVPQYIITVNFNGETYNSEVSGFLFRNTENIQFCLNSNANFSYFKKRLENKLRRGPTSNIFYQHPVFTGENQVTFYQVAVEDDEDLQNMFCNHEYSGYDSIELYVVFQDTERVDPTEEA